MVLKGVGSVSGSTALKLVSGGRSKINQPTNHTATIESNNLSNKHYVQRMRNIKIQWYNVGLFKVIGPVYIQKFCEHSYISWTILNNLIIKKSIKINDLQNKSLLKKDSFLILPFLFYTLCPQIAPVIWLYYSERKKEKLKFIFKWFISYDIFTLWYYIQ